MSTQVKNTSGAKKFTREQQEMYAAARYKLLQTRPYFARAIYALIPRPAPGIKTFGVDKNWRLYMDPDLLTTEEEGGWGVEGVTAALMHEIGHVLRGHADRAQRNGVDAIQHQRWNIAGDLEINDDLKAEGIVLPVAACYPDEMGFDEGLLAEQYYAMLPETQFACKKCQEDYEKHKQDQNNSGDENSDDSQSGDEQDDESGAGENSEGAESGQGDESGDSGEGQGEGSDDGQGDGSGSGEGQGHSHDHGDGSGSGSGEGQGEGSGSGSGSGSDGHTCQTEGPGCGSGASGVAAPWEEDANEGESISSAQAERVQRGVAVDMKNHEKNKGRGSVPAGWSRWAEEFMKPVIPWRKELNAAVRGGYAEIAGRVDYNMNKPSRRGTPRVVTASGGFRRGPKAVMPSLRKPIPRIAVVIDTSGSMSDGMLAEAYAEVKGVLKGVGARKGDVTVIACDAAAEVVKNPFAGRVELYGGGGTHMGKGIELAMNQKVEPNFIIVLTDGYTPWPDEKPAAKVIVGIVGNDECEGPEWARTIHISAKRDAQAA